MQIPKLSCNMERRHYVAVLAFLGFCNAYAIRVNLSVAILEMTKNVTSVLADGSVVNVVGDFADWSSMTKGAVLSSFFYGYIVTQMAGGWLAGRLGGRLVFGVGLLINGFFTLLIPIISPWGAGSLIFCRVCQGLSQGVAYPSIHAVWSRWAPSAERTKLATIAFSGSYFGTVFALPVSGLLAEYIGWKSVFVFFGIMCVLWCILWLLTVADDPSLDKHITSSELSLIQASVGTSYEQSHNLVPPWKDILLSPPVWAIAAAHFAENWGFYTMLTELPQFVEDLEPNYHIKKASFLSAIPYLVMGIVVQLGGRLADYLRDKRNIPTVYVRKAFNCGAFIGQAIFIVASSYVTNVAGAMICVTLAVGLGGFAWSGFSVNHLDIAPQYASVLMGLTNSVATIPGMLSPVVTGSLVKDGKMYEWEAVWWISAAVYIVGAVIYVALASGSIQPWAEIPEGYTAHIDEPMDGTVDDDIMD